MNESSEILKLVKRLNDNLKKEMNKVLATYGITFSQLQMLFAISHKGGECTLKELEQHFHRAQSSIAGVAKRLEEKKLIHSFTDKSDKRIKHVRLTEEGERLCLDSEEGRQLKEEKLTASLSEEEKRQFIQLLTLVLAALE